MDDPLWTGTVNALGSARALLDRIPGHLADAPEHTRGLIAHELARIHAAVDEAVRTHISAWRHHVDCLAIPVCVDIDQTADTKPTTKDPDPTH